MQISELTRRDIIDAMEIEKISWSGRMDEVKFLSRIYNLKELPSTDSRYDDAEGDIRQHRINNYDWEDYWVFGDSRFSLQIGDDEIFLRFLCETLHPRVRPDVAEVERLCELYNSYLQNDGFQIVEKTRISSKPVFVGKYSGAMTPGINTAIEVLASFDAGYISQQITRMEAAVINDPALAIGTAKELVETCCKTILDNRNIDIPKNSDLSKLVKTTSKELALTPNNIPEQAKAADTIKRLLSNLATITQGISELRNQYGTGHGKKAGVNGLSSRHAKLAVGAASTLAVFLLETH